MRRREGERDRRSGLEPVEQGTSQNGYVVLVFPFLVVCPAGSLATAQPKFFSLNPLTTNNKPLSTLPESVEPCA